jgi:hypothetical protein
MAGADLFRFDIKNKKSPHKAGFYDMYPVNRAYRR